MSFTLEQEKAIYTKNKNILVSAAAGSGKTTVLTERIIQTIQNSKNNIDNLLVVTFTRSAASEMKNRIANSLNNILKNEPNNQHLKSQISLLDKSYITTIDSFCLSIVKKYFKNLNIDPNFKIGDQAELEMLKLESLNDFFENLYDSQNTDFLKLLNAYSNKSNDQDFLDKFLFLYNQVQNLSFPKEWLNFAPNYFNINTKDEFFNSYVFEIAINQCKNYLKSALNIYEQIESKYKSILGEDFKKPKYLIDDKDILDNLTLSIKNKKFTYFLEQTQNLKFSTFSKSSIKDFPEEAEYIKFLRDNLKNLVLKIKEEIFTYSIDEILQQNKECYPLIKSFCSLLVEFDNYFLQIKKDKKIFSFNDISHFCLELLIEKNTLNPTKIAKEYQKKFKEIIIDEYQDSNLIQELILKSISNNYNKFMVGDIKQCIYKFRNADPEIFIEKYNSYKDSTEPCERIDLNKNFRSNISVINGINFIFEQIMSHELGDVKYDKYSKLYFAADYNDNSCINLNESEKNELYLIENKNSNDTQDDSLEYINDLKNIELEANFIANRIKKLINEDEFKVLNHKTKTYEPIKYKDIVILLRNTKSSSEILLKTLLENNIPAFTKTSNGFFDFIEVEIIINLLSIIDNPLQDLPLISILHSSIFCFSSDELLEIKLHSKNKLFFNCILDYINSDSEDDINLKLKEKLQNFIFKLRRWQDLSKRLTTHQLLSLLYEETNYFIYVGLLSKGEIRQANLLSLLEKAAQFEETNLQGIFNFINYLNKIKKGSVEGEANILSEDENLVRIMSIHKSKGLEFPVVFVSMLSSYFNQNDLRNPILFHSKLGLGSSFISNIPENIEFDKNNFNLTPRFSYETFQKNIIKNKVYYENLSEEMRILYVALTRAKEKLILTGVCKDTEKQIKKWKFISNDKLNPYLIIQNSSNFLDWVGTCLQKNNTYWNINIVNKQDIYNPKIYNSKNLNNFLNILENLNINNNIQISKALNDKLNWKYHNEIEQNLKTTSTISEIKINYQKELLDLNHFNFNTSPNLPNFYKHNPNKISSAKKGSIYHTILQHIDFNISTEIQLNEFLSNLIDKNLIEKDDIKLIENKKILNFLCSNLANRIRNSKYIKREQSFVIGLSPFEVYQNEKYKNLKSTILVNGIIDLYFKENDYLVLVDYKTGRYTSKKSIIQNYSTQLNIYKKALENSNKLKVNDSIIYMLNNNLIINL